jgi:hypothetical protein
MICPALIEVIGMCGTVSVADWEITRELPVMTTQSVYRFVCVYILLKYVLPLMS